MDTNAIAENRAYYEQLTPDNCAMLLIDHQAGLFLGVQSIDRQILKNNVIGLAKTAKVFNLPTVLFTSSAKGPNGPTIPELTSSRHGTWGIPQDPIEWRRFLVQRLSIRQQVGKGGNIQNINWVRYQKITKIPPFPHQPPKRECLPKRRFRYALAYLIPSSK